MLSRVASSIYWMSRYLERADNVARFIDVNTGLILDMGWERETAQWDAIVHASGDTEDFNKRYQGFTEKNVLRFLTFDEENPNSIFKCIQNARENARTVREIISSDVWEKINSLFHYVEKHKRKGKLDDLQEFFSTIHNSNYLLAGLIENTMSHGEGWLFARVGRLLERADKTARIMDVKYFSILPSTDYLDSPYDTVEWGAVLKSVNGFEMYRKQFHRASYRNVSQFLILDKYFPRSIFYCVNTANRSLHRIAGMLGIYVQTCDEMNKLEKILDNIKIDTVLENGLHEFIDTLQFNLNIIDRSLHETFFEIEPPEQKGLKNIAI